MAKTDISDLYQEHLTTAMGMLTGADSTIRTINKTLAGDNPPKPDLVSALSQYAGVTIKAAELHLAIAQHLTGVNL